MVLYYNNDRGNVNNRLYPFAVNVESIEDLQEIVAHDHVCAKYQENHRKKDNFICADCSMFDVDNEGEDPSKWIGPEAVRKAFSDVPFYISYSRNHMKEKDGKKARPKFHVYFPDAAFTNVDEYEKHKRNVWSYFPAFDKCALDVARFFIGVDKPNIEYYDGTTKLFDFMQTISHESVAQNNATDIIPQGQRNNTLHKFALRVLTRLGDQTDEAYRLYTKESSKCFPLLDYKEVKSIWNSALKYYSTTIKTSSSYIPPEQFSHGHSVMPQEFTDLGQADTFARTFYKKIRYSTATNYLFFNGVVWLESELKVRSLAQNLVADQLNEACSMLKTAQDDENKAVVNGDKVKETSAKGKIKQAERYRKHALTYQHTLRLSATMKEAQPMLEVSIERLDSDAFLLNTPDGTVDLRTKEIRPHNPEDFCTKITNKGPTEGAKLFDDFLDVITCGDKYLAEYLQYVAGMIAVGKVFCENLIIAYGCGRNGKSTFFNLLSRVLGSYAGCLSSEILTTNCRKNKSPEYAELRGKRLVIAAELEDGTHLDTSIVKKLCSTDPICAEKKYKDPFSYIPTHTVVLYTNHLPNVYALDSGTWRRLVVIPFNAVISSTEDIKNFADELYENAGGAVMSWIVDGAYKFISAGYKFEPPEVVRQAINAYREENDWLSNYISECCEVDKSFIQPSGSLYQDYRKYSQTIGEFPRSNASFNKALAEKGFQMKRNGTGSFICGLRLQLKTPFSDFPKISASQVMGNGGEIQESDDIEVDF